MDCLKTFLDNTNGNVQEHFFATKNMLLYTNSLSKINIPWDVSVHRAKWVKTYSSFPLLFSEYECYKSIELPESQCTKNSKKLS